MKGIEKLSREVCKALRSLKRASPTILSYASAVGVAGTAVLTARAVPKAMQRIKEAEHEKGSKLTGAEKAAVSIPAFLPAVASGAGTIISILGANALNKKQQAVLTSAYALTSSMFTEYKNKVKELYGDDSEKEILEAIAKDKPHERASDGKVLFYEPYYGSFFESTMYEVLEAEHLLNRLFVLRGYVSLNDFYSLLGLEKTEAGEALGWSIYMGCEFYGYQWIVFSLENASIDDGCDEEGLECYIITYPFSPTEDYLV